MLLTVSAALSAAVLVACEQESEDAAPALTQTGLAPSVVRPAEPEARRTCGTLGRGDDSPQLKIEVVRGQVACREARRVLTAHYQEAATPDWSCTGPEGFVACKRLPGTEIRARFLCRRWYPRDWDGCLRTLGPR